MKKKCSFIIMLIILITAIIVNMQIKSKKIPLYGTAFKEVNIFLNKKNIKLNTNEILSTNFKNNITVKNNGDRINFSKESILSNKSEDIIQINYKSGYNYNFISVLKVFEETNILSEIDYSKFEYNNKENYYIDELNNPIVILEANITNNKIDFIYCNNLKDKEGRNYFFYDILRNNDQIRYTKANEIFFWYNNYFYYIGTDMNLSYIDDARLLVNTILDIQN